MNRMTADEARDLLLSLAAAPKTETLPLGRCFGRVLAEDISARYNVPPFARSVFDGYALRGADTREASRETPVTLRLTEEIPAGKAPQKPVGPGEAAKILTGGPMPAGTDAVVKYEETEFTHREVRLSEPVRPGSNYAPAGEDVLAGAMLGRKGDRVSYALAGLLAGQGLGEVSVCAKPRIAVLSTGSELLQPGQTPEPAKIYNSNSAAVCARIEAEGAETTDLGSVPDGLAPITGRIDAALRAYDMVITTGGASVGDYDWAERAAKALGAEVLFWKCAMKPGGSMVGAVRDGKLLLSLSGNPGAAMLGLFKVGLPAVRALCGRRDCVPEVFTAALDRDYNKKSPMFRLLRGRLSVSEGRVFFTPADADGNGVLSSLLACDALAEIPAGTGALPEGSPVRVFCV